MKKSVAIISAKAIRTLGTVFGKKGTALPGLVAEKIDPHLLRKLKQDNFPKGIVVITGTNGKTTTAKMLADILRANGMSIIHNTAGSNLRRGIISTILAECSNKGVCQQEMAIFEVDEAYVPGVCAELKPDIVVVTNLFRDQLDRYGELDSIATNFKNTFCKITTKLILNADDPLVASMGRETINQVSYFGISDYIGEVIEHDYTADSIFDIVTGKKLQYSQRYFGHMGIYRSENSSTVRPKPNVDLIKMTKFTKQKSEFVVSITTKDQKITLNLPGLYNIYNALAAIDVANTLGVDLDIITKSISQVKSAFGRGEIMPYQDKALQLILFKNPTGFNQVIQTYLKPKPQTTPIMFSVNDNIADGKDVSWLWDSALEDIADYKGKIIVSGLRALDMALRLKYAGINMSNVIIEPDQQKAVELLLDTTQKREVGYIMATYTAMLDIRKIVTKNSGYAVKDINQ